MDGWMDHTRVNEKFIYMTNLLQAHLGCPRMSVTTSLL